MKRWTITRKSGAPLFEPVSLVVHATKFNHVIGIAIDQYSKKLKTADFSDELWKNFIKKMKCHGESQQG